MRGNYPSWFRPLAVVHGGYWILTGVWPLVHRASFEWVAGPKYDFWLVETVGLLVAIAGATILLAGVRRRLTPEIILLAAGSALALASIDTYYAMIGRIRSVYLADAAFELTLAAAWMVIWLRAEPRSAALNPGGSERVP